MFHFGSIIIGNHLLLLLLLQEWASESPPLTDHGLGDLILAQASEMVLLSGELGCSTSAIEDMGVYD